MSKEKVQEGVSSKLTLQEGGCIAQAVADEGYVEATAQEEETFPSLDMDNAGTGVGPSSTVGLEHPEQVS